MHCDFKMEQIGNCIIENWNLISLRAQNIPKQNISEVSHGKGLLLLRFDQKGRFINKINLSRGKLLENMKTMPRNQADSQKSLSFLWALTVCYICCTVCLKNS